VAQAISRKIKGGTWKGTQIHALEKKLRKRERENNYKGASPLMYWTFPLGGLASLPFSLMPRRSCPRSKRLGSMHVHATNKEQANRQAKKRIEGKHAKWQARKRCQTRANKHVKHTNRQTNILSNKRGCPRRTNVDLDQISIVPLDWSMNDTQTHAWTCRLIGQKRIDPLWWINLLISQDY